MDDFIGIYDNVLTLDECNQVIAYYEHLKKINSPFLYDRQRLKDAPPHKKDDETYFLMEKDEIFIDKSMSIINPFVDKFSKCYDDYVNRYSIIKESSKHGVAGMRFQKTSPGQGYHQWHFETTSHGSSPRFITFMLYLNDIEEGGETEFLYLHRRVKPKAGTVLIWPSGYTHTHRGNPPLTGDKYIITGWLSYFA